VRGSASGGEHARRGTSARARKGPWPRASERTPRPAATSWAALLRGKDVSRARRYSTQERFETDDVLEHPVFGIGLVREVRGDKISVAFKADVKTLVHGKG